MRALRRFTVRLALPAPLQPLSELVMNLRWSWHPASLDLFREVDPDVWESVGQDPVRLLGEVSPERLANAIFWWHRHDGWRQPVAGGNWGPYRPILDAERE